MYQIPNDLPLHHFRQPETLIMYDALIPGYLISNLDEIARLCRGYTQRDPFECKHAVLNLVIP